MKQPMHRNALAEGREHAGGPEGRDPGGSLVTPSLTRRGALGVLSAAAGVLAGCTALPSSSGVTRSGVAASDTNALIETAPGPGEGDSAEDVVNGFLRAAIAGFSDDFTTAKQFLTERTAAQWKPLETVSAYNGSTEPQVSVAADGSFKVTSGQVGVLDSLGVFTPAQEGATYVGEFSLATNSTGQWRITGLPHGILLPFSRLMQNFAVSSLAFLSQDRTRFVSELRWYLRSSQADSLVSGLLAGPSSWLSGGAFTLIPRNAEPAGRGVVVEAGTATVHLSADSDPASEDSRRLMVAQIEQSLVQISGIDRVRVLAGTVDLGAPAQLTPMAPEVGGIVGMSEGAVVRGTGSSRVTLATDRALGTGDARSPSLGADGTVYALRADLGRTPGVGSSIVYDTTSAESDAGTITLIVSDDAPRASGKTVYEGRLPARAGEIAIGGPLASALGIGVGDDITISHTGNKATYLVTGLTQSTMSLGKSAVLTVDGVRQATPSYQPKTLAVYADGADAKTLFTRISSSFAGRYTSMVDMQAHVDSILNTYISMSQGLAVGILSLTGIVAILVVGLVVASLIARSRRDFGVLKALGFTNRQLSVQVIAAQLPSMCLGTAAGVALGWAFAMPALGQLLRSTGIMRLDAGLAAGPVVCLGAAFLALPVLLSLLLMRRARRITSRDLLAE